jgi:hypothetical protein
MRNIDVDFVAFSGKLEVDAVSGAHIPQNPSVGRQDLR